VALTDVSEANQEVMARLRMEMAAQPGVVGFPRFR
jgi:hypothetical protein